MMASMLAYVMIFAYIAIPLSILVLIRAIRIKAGRRWIRGSSLLLAVLTVYAMVYYWPTTVRVSPVAGDAVIIDDNFNRVSVLEDDLKEEWAEFIGGRRYVRSVSRTLYYPPPAQSGLHFNVNVMSKSKPHFSTIYFRKDKGKYTRLVADGQGYSIRDSAGFVNDVKALAAKSLPEMK
ncbi:hypothetical protein [Paenibacillus sp. NPDC058071]|uniref:hypothetical protein n=1 Tax=Paenibacillus sp. NPDC058071 TaxID=3346326 RepID=UPI0036DAE456